MYANSRICAAGHYLPSVSVKTSELIEATDLTRYGVESTLIQENVGVIEVRHSLSHQKPSDLAIEACRDALQKSDVQHEAIDFIIFCGVEGDYVEPSTAHNVQSALGLTGACFDVSNACLGFTTGMQIGNAMITAGLARYVLVCTGEKLSNLSKAVIKELQSCHDLAVLKKKLGFLTVGDAGGAVVLGPAEAQDGFRSFEFVSQGDLAQLCYYKWDKEYIDGQMIMDKICASGLRAHKDIYARSLRALMWEPEDIDCLVTHQVGKRVFDKFSEIFSVEPEKMTRSFDIYGNIATATLPLNLSMAIENKKIKKGDKLFFGMSGSGLSICQFGMVA